MGKRNITWNTTKTDAGFAFRVYEVIPRAVPNSDGSYADFVTLKTGALSTRAQAKGQAQRWCRYLKAAA